MNPSPAEQLAADCERYDVLKARQKSILAHCAASGELPGELFNRDWREIEAIKNRHGGMPPAKPVQ
jgi:hypothetical protein